MFIMILVGINLVVLLMLFGVYSKLGELNTAIKRLTPKPESKAPPKPAAVTPPTQAEN